MSDRDGARAVPAPRAAVGLRLLLAWAAAALLAATAVVALLGAQRETRLARQARLQLQQQLDAHAAQAEGEERRAADTARALARLRDQAQALGELLGEAATPPLQAATLALRGGLTREAGRAPRLLLAPAAAIVRLQLAAPPAPGATYRAALQTPEGRELWAREGLAAVAREGGPATVAFTVPAPLLSPGQYVVTLSGTAVRRRGDTDSEYVFEVRRAP